jgi:hypothetical protein
VSETPLPQRDVSEWRRVLGISHGLTSPMTNYTDPIQLLTRELDTISATSLGRLALQRIEVHGLDIEGCTTLNELARLIEWDPRHVAVCHPTLSGLVSRAASDHVIALTGLVAMRRPLRDIWFSLARSSNDPDVGAELLVALWTSLELAPIDASPGDILSTVFLQTRRTIRSDQRRQSILESIEGLDFADERVATIAVRDDELERLITEEVICANDAELIRVTRILGMSLVDYVQTRGLHYDVTRKRRRRAERTIAIHLSRNAGRK